MQICVSILLCASLWLAGCASQPEGPYAEARARGYVETEELHETIAAVTPLDAESWAISFGLSARNFRILAAVTPDAAELAARAEALRQAGTEVYATILVQEQVPAKSPEAFARAVEGPYPWIVVRLGTSPNPVLATR
jgi:hypothetical protein